MVANSVECFAAEIQRRQRDIGTPERMVVATRNERAERIFTGVTSGAMAAVVTKSNCLGERDVQPEGTGNRRCNLGHLESMREACALVIVGEHENLRFARQTTKRRCVEDAITVAFEACPKLVGFLGSCPRACTNGSCCAGGQGVVFVRLAMFSTDEGVRVGSRKRVGMSETH